MTNTPEPQKSLGQHWLNDRQSLEMIVNSAQIQADETVFEIGAGMGSLTNVLLDRGAEVIALEYDSNLAHTLVGRIGLKGRERLTVIEGDVRQFNFSELKPGYKIVANIPYYLTAHLLRQITGDLVQQPSLAVLLIQREVAERVAAGPGDTSFISLAVQYYYEVKLGEVLPAKLFTPPPKVDSQVLILTKRVKPLFDDIDTKLFWRLMKAGFSNRRKTLLNSLGAGLRLRRPVTEALLVSAKISPQARAQELDMDAWHSLYQAFQALSPAPSQNT